MDPDDPEEPVQVDLEFDPPNDSVEEILKDKADIEPFRRKREDYLFKFEGLVNMVITASLLIGAHLNLVSIWWLFGFFALTIIPPEANKVRKYGLKRYLGAMNFRMISLKEFGVILGGLVTIFTLLITMTVLTINVLSPSAMEGGGHLMGDAFFNIYIWAGGVLLMYLVVGPLEEYFFRHKLQRFFKKRSRTTVSILLTNVIFSLAHIPVLAVTGSVISYVIPLTLLAILGSIFSAQYEYTDNLAVPALTHSTYNSIILTILFAAQLTH